MKSFFLLLIIFFVFLGCTPQPAEKLVTKKVFFVFSSGNEHSLRKDGEAVLLSGPPLVFVKKLTSSDSIEINFSDEMKLTSSKFKFSMSDFVQEKPDSFSCTKFFEGRDRTIYFSLIEKNLDKKGGLYGYYFICTLRKK